MRMSGDYSLYFHVPFCTKKCDYCHFYVIPDKEPLKQLYMQALMGEWQQKAPLLTGSLVSVYFGGGTPSLLGPKRIAEILSWISPPPGCEITLEANPDGLTRELAEDYRKIGINRISLGVQSFDAVLLKTLGRLHDAKKAEEAVFLIHEAGISNCSIDLMYDLPGQTLASWQNTLEIAAKLPITHLSLYNLTIEPHTVFFKHRAALQSSIPDEEMSLEMLEMAVDHLERAGLKRYEISAFARPGFESRHNTGYWAGRPFLGLGPSAFSHWEGRRFRNWANIHTYARAIESGKSPVDFEETLSQSAQIKEALAIRLRLLEGAPVATPLPQETLESLQKLITLGLIEVTHDAYRLTPRGTIFYDSVAEELIE